MDKACANVEEFAKKLKEFCSDSCLVIETEGERQVMITIRDEIDNIAEEFKGSDKKVYTSNGTFEVKGSDKKGVKE